MKYYKSVLKKVEETNYKKGIVRIDTESGIYKTSRLLYYIAFAWFMLFHGLYLISNSTAFFFYEKAAQNIHTELFVSAIIVFVFMIAAVVSVARGWHIAAGSLTLIGGVAQMVSFYSNDNVALAFLDKGVLGNKFFWFHFAPPILLILFVLIISTIGIKSSIQLKKDYTRALASMFTKYSEDNKGASDSEWTAHLEELDRKIEEQEKAEKKENKRKKRGKS